MELLVQSLRLCRPLRRCPGCEPLMHGRLLLYAREALCIESLLCGDWIGKVDVHAGERVLLLVRRRRRGRGNRHLLLRGDRLLHE